MLRSPPKKLCPVFRKNHHFSPQAQRTSSPLISLRTKCHGIPNWGLYKRVATSQMQTFSTDSLTAWVLCTVIAEKSQKSRDFHSIWNLFFFALCTEYQKSGIKHVGLLHKGALLCSMRILRIPWHFVLREISGVEVR